MLFVVWLGLDLLSFVSIKTTKKYTDAMYKKRKDPELAAKIAAQIMRVRKGRGISRLDLAKITGISVNTLSNWETKHHSPSVVQLVAVANALSVHVSDLLEENATKTIYVRPSMREIGEMILGISRYWKYVGDIPVDILRALTDPATWPIVRGAISTKWPQMQNKNYWTRLSSLTGKRWE